MQTQKRPTDAVRAELKTLISELAALKDDLKVQAHLATMELRDRWNALEKRHAELEQSLRNSTHDAVDSVRESIARLRTDVTQLREDAGIDPEC